MGDTDSQSDTMGVESGKIRMDRGKGDEATL